MRSLERVNIRTNVRTYVLTYIRTGQTLYPLHNFVVRGDNNGTPLNKFKPCFPPGIKIRIQYISLNEKSKDKVTPVILIIPSVCNCFHIRNNFSLPVNYR